MNTFEASRISGKIDIPEPFHEQVTRLDQRARHQEALNVLSRVDFQTLNHIFREIQKRAGVDPVSGAPDSAGLVPREGIQVFLEETKSMTKGGWCDLEKRNIYMVADYLDEPKTGSVEEFRNHMLSLLIHEETHAAGANVSYENDQGMTMKLRSFFRAVPEKKIGFAQVDRRFGRVQRKFNQFSEGVTDRIAEEVHAEYLRQTGDRKYFSQEMEKPALVKGYREARSMVTVFIEMVAEVTGVPSSKVWEALVQGYMKGLDLGSTELAQEFDRVFFSGFTDEISQKEYESSADLPLFKMVERVRKEPLAPERANAIEQAFYVFLTEAKRFDDE